MSGLSRDITRVRKDPRYVVAEQERLMGTEWMNRPDRHLEYRQLYAEVRMALLQLKPRERLVLKMRFGINRTGHDHTLDEVAKTLSTAWHTVTRTEVREIEAKALRKLLHPSRSRLLRPFLQR